MSSWRKALYSAITVALLLGALEFGLALRGGPDSPRPDPYVGFSSSSPLFVETVRGGEAVMATAPDKRTYFNDQQFALRKPPGAYRIFCLGGSTTYGHPWEDAMSFCAWLRRFLQAAEPSRRWEVVNAGGISFASYRVAALMEELNTYQPDLYVAYTGHNEFLEERSYRGIREMPGWLREANLVLGRSRLFTAIGEAVAPAPEPFQLGPEIADRLSRTIGPQDYRRDDAARADILAHYRFNLARMAGLARAGGAGLVFVMPVANLKDMSPFKSESALAGEALASWQQRFREARALTEHEARSARLDALQREDPRHAEVHYERARSLLALRRHGEARAAFLRALDEDVAPLRMLPAMGEALRAVAAGQGVALLDFAALLEERNRRELGHDILGKEWFVDHVHLNVEGYRLLGLELLRHLQERGVVAGRLDAQTVASVTAEALATLDAAASGRALMNLGQVLGWAGRLEEAHRLLQQARELMGEDLVVMLRLAKSAERLGRPDEALALYQDALRAFPAHAEPHRWLAEFARQRGDASAERHHRGEVLRLAPASPGDVASLAELLAAQGDWPAAAQQFGRLAALAPDSARARINQGIALANAGDAAAARAAFEDAQRLEPRSVDAALGLAALAEAGGDPEAAAQWYARAVERGPAQPAAHLGLGTFLATRGRPGEAIPHFTEALRLSPDSADAHWNLAVAYRQTGRESLARDHFAAAERLRGGR